MKDRICGIGLALALALGAGSTPAVAHDVDGVCERGDVGEPCEADGDKCTREKCNEEKECVPAGAVKCPGPAGICDNGKECDPDTGSCVDKPDKPEGTPCEVDRNKCTVDACNDNGYCVRGPEKDCDDADVCTDDTCDEDTGECKNVDDPSNDPVCTGGSDLAVTKDATCACGDGEGAGSDGEVVACSGSGDACGISYTITVANVGVGSVTGVFVSDVLPDAVALVGSTATQGVYDPNTGLWDVGALGSAGSAMLTLDVETSSPDGAVVGMITNCAELSASDPADGNSANDSDCAVVALPGGDLGACEARVPSALSRRFDRAARLLRLALDADSPRRARKLSKRAQRALALTERAIARFARRDNVDAGCLGGIEVAVDGMSRAARHLTR